MENKTLSCLYSKIFRNCASPYAILVYIIYILIPTSNHNAIQVLLILWIVVYLLIPTSNHNWPMARHNTLWLYIFWFLHQTTTTLFCGSTSTRCISFDSYIKPQLHCPIAYLQLCCISFDSYIKPQLHQWILRRRCVVYLLIPTSNHNPVFVSSAPYSVVYLLIPTSNHNLRLACTCPRVLYIFWFLHQTTTLVTNGAPWNELYIFWFLHQTTT